MPGVTICQHVCVTTLRTSSLVMPSGQLGPVNPLPPLFGPADVHAAVTGDELDAEMRRGLEYGRATSVLPYLMQDGYDRALDEAEHPTAVLENDLMRAEFLLDLGGRLWSLIDKRSGRELLYRNPAFRPANLALRNAWFAGGVEWNLGTTGHWPLTCSPLHAIAIERNDREPALRMYEYERMRGLIVEIEASLPERQPLLTVRITIRNPRDTEVPVYWWSNIAVPEADDVRVVAPASSAWQFEYDQARISRRPFPTIGDVDRSYTTRSRDAADYFFDLGSTPTPWIAALDAAGCGLFQASTSRLRGRKLFLWGSGRGGRHWQRWLTDGGGEYLEIQAGLARTQLEHLPMPAATEWSWVEAYGLAEADRRAVHGADWRPAVEAAARAIDSGQVAKVLEAESVRDRSDDRIIAGLQRASGFGALEDERRRRAGEPPLSSARTPFDPSDIGPDEQWWAAALRGEALPSDPAAAPLGYQSDPAWLAVAEAADGWAARLHEGVIHAAAGELDDAERAWRASVASADNAWAWRALAALHAHRGEDDRAAEAYGRALELQPTLAPLIIETMRFLIGAHRPAAALTVLERHGVHPTHGRIRLLEARAALDAGDLARCGRLLEAGIEVPDLKEGEESLDALWLDYQARRLASADGVRPDADGAVPGRYLARAAEDFPPPPEYDFRMHESGRE
jgi:tetratricopeptide (TPR) repeat protein